MKPATLSRVQRIVADLFSVPVAEITLATSPDTINSWDSLQHLNLMLALEQEFEVQFAPEEIEKSSSVQSIVGLLDLKLQAAEKSL
jgi:acyl carrier protein